MMKKYAGLLVLLVMIVSVVGCGPSGPVVVTPTASGSTAQPTDQVAPAPTTAVSGATATSAPGSTPQSGATATTAPIRITFATGATAAFLNGSIAAHGTNQYVVNIDADQLLDVSLTPQEGLHTSIYGVDGTMLQSGMGEAVGFRGTVPSAQDYIIQVSAADQPVTYSLNVIIPQRITFEHGQTNLVREGRIPAAETFHYVVNVQAGQFVEVSVSPDDVINMSFYGVDGEVLKSGMGGGAFFRGAVPTNQDYIISLSAQDAQSFTMNLLIPQRITFAAGATSAELDGTLDAHDSVTFSVSAQAGQQLQVTFTPANSAKMSIYGVDGSVLWSGMGEGTLFSGTLTITQDYCITFQSGDQPVEYHLEVVIE
jgi:hypothetical protein